MMNLDMSIKLTQTCWRYHDKRYFSEGPIFYKTFEDGPWKWAARERFSPAHLACGHFLALSKEGAEAEAKAYRINKRRRFLLGVDLEIDEILDLTREDVLAEVYRTVIEERPRPRLHILRMLIHEDIGGNALTDEIGFWAVREGFKGILYFSSRSLQSYRPSFMSSSDRQWGLYVADEILEELRSDLSTQNLVVFSGRYLTPGIKRYWRNGHTKLDNPYYRFPLDELDPLLEYDSEDWDYRLGSFIQLNRQRILKVGWNGKVEKQVL